MATASPFIAASPGALRHLEVNPRFNALVNQGLFKDIWGSELQAFWGTDVGEGADDGEILDTPTGRTRAFSADVSVYRCVDIRGAALASVPLKIWDQADPNRRTEVEHEALGVVQQTNPQHYVAGPQLMRYSLGSRDLHGSFAWQIVYDQGGRTRGRLPRELYWLIPSQYKVVSGEDMKPPQPKIAFGGLKVRRGKGMAEEFIPAEDLIYAPTYNPGDPLRGMSKISALRTDLNLRLYGQNSNLWFFRNNQRPDVVVTGAFSPTTENVGLMRRIWKAAFGGDHSRGPAFLPSDMKVQLLTMAAKDAEWLGQRQSAREDILAAFGVPPPVYGDLARATYENIRSAFEGFWRGMIPECDEIAWFLTQQLLWKWPDAKKAGLVFGFDYNQIEALQEDSNAVWERALAFMKEIREQTVSRLLLPNQAREVLGVAARLMGMTDKPWQGKIPGGDQFYVRINEVPIDESSVQATIDANSARAGIATGQTNKPGNGHWVLPDARDVKVPITPPTAPEVPKPGDVGADLPSGKALLPPTRVVVHNHLTKLEWPQFPDLPEEGGSDRGVGEPEDGDPEISLLSVAHMPDELVAPYQASDEDHPSGEVGQQSDPVRDAAHLLHAQDWLKRRLKRHYQDQQTYALRVLRAAQAASEPLQDPSELVQVDAGRQNVEEIITAALGLAHMTSWGHLTPKDVAANIEDNTMVELVAAFQAAAEDGEPARALQDRVREVFRIAIEDVAASIATQLPKEAA